MRSSNEDYFFEVAPKGNRGPAFRVREFMHILRSWFGKDALRGRFLDNQSGIDWGFEAILHASPFSAFKVWKSAVSRNRGDLIRATSPIRTNPTIPRGSIKSAPFRLLAGRFHRPTWGLELLRSSPFQSGPATTTPILPSPGILRADPFPMERGGQEWLAFEEMLPDDRGRLRIARKQGDRWEVEPGEILPRPHHLSWPNIFRLENRVFMIPESGEAGTVELWEATDFPRKWEKRRELLQGRPWHDPMLLRHEGLWWLFVSSGGSDPQDHSSRLDIFWSEDLENGPFHPHPENPVSTFLSGARPAGAFIESENGLLRPSQDCRAGYGTGIVIHRVDALSRSEYRETFQNRIDPPPGAKGIHTLNRMPDGNWIVDVCR
ncbi:MAG: hypothetical protein H6686_01100 [Fibrobacteria bacterium]|nr:hypothetical protein [Fibrobacteria bacterium]